MCSNNRDSPLDRDLAKTLHRIEEHLRAIRGGAGTTSRDWQTIQDVAEQLQVSRNTVERLIASGKLKAAENRGTHKALPNYRAALNGEAGRRLARPTPLDHPEVRGGPGSLVPFVSHESSPACFVCKPLPEANQNENDKDANKNLPFRDAGDSIYPFAEDVQDMGHVSVIPRAVCLQFATAVAA